MREVVTQNEERKPFARGYVEKEFDEYCNELGWKDKEATMIQRCILLQNQEILSLLRKMDDHIDELYKEIKNLKEK